MQYVQMLEFWLGPTSFPIKSDALRIITICVSTICTVSVLNVEGFEIYYYKYLTIFVERYFIQCILVLLVLRHVQL